MLAMSQKQNAVKTAIVAAEDGEDPGSDMR